MWRAGEMGGDRFPIARRGYDRAKVDAFVAALQERAQAAEERLRQLEGQLAGTRARLEELEADMRLALTDPERASRLVGAGASELVRSASDAALSIRTQAERTATELIERARAEATELVAQARHTIEAELASAESTRASLLEEAEQARKAAIEEGKREGRALVHQAREYAERLRMEAETQVASHRDEIRALEQAAEELRGLLSRARRLVSEALEHPGPPRAEPTLAAPQAVPGRTAPRDPGAEALSNQETKGAPSTPLEREGLGTLTNLIEEVAAVAVPTKGLVTPDPVSTDPPPSPAPIAPEATPAKLASEPEAPPVEEEATRSTAEERDPGDRVARLEELFRSLKADRVAPPRDAPSAERAFRDPIVSAPSSPAAGGASEPKEEMAATEIEEELVDPALRARIEELFAPLQLDLSRRVKRLVQDELNTLLATIRSSGRQGALAWLDDHDPSTYERELAGLVHHLVAAGCSLGEPPDDGPRTQEATDAITRALVAALGELTLSRVKAALSEVDEEPELVSVANTLYREVRTRQLDELAHDYAATAFCTGVRLSRHAIGFVWLTRSTANPCADCEDNVLAGVNAVDELFPTGHENPPSHPGCTCLIAPVFA